MPLAAGTRLGPYEIVSSLGAGGMGEVYRARDTKLGRDVALKLLPDAFAADPERLARFEREAKTLASLNHPHIAQIHGLEESSPVPGAGRASIRALVMELVEGEDLAQRLARGAIPVDETLAIAKQIADALEAAHEQGIIHRDLKPANIKLRPDGTVKVLDFGLAKAAAADADVSNSPTFTVAATQMGVIVGTAAYMSPEQARGKPVDKRTDIWAFGCVLYEMLTSRQAFGGETVSDIVAAVLTREPDYAVLPAATPASVRRLLVRCLQRDPRQRLRDIGDAALELAAGNEPAATAAPVAATRARWQVPVAIVASAAVTAALIAWPLRRDGNTDARPLRAVTIEGAGFADSSTVAVSPKGDAVVYFLDRAVGNDGLIYRPLHSFESRTLITGIIAVHPFFSPRGDAVAFSDPTRRAVYRLALDGGKPVEVIRIGETLPGAWLPDDSLILSTVRIGDRSIRGLARVPVNGGPPEQVTTPAGPAEIHQMPEPLPGGRLVLFTTVSSGDHRIAVVDLQTKQHRPIAGIQAGSTPRYLSSGHLVYFEPTTLQLRAVRFDPTRAEVIGDSVVVLENVHRGIDLIGSYQISADGHLFYSALGGETSAGSFGLLWAGPTKQEQKISDLRTTWAQPRVSPDGKRLAVRETRTPDCTMWVYDLERGSRTRLTGGFDAHNPIWHPDGRQLLFDGRTDQGVRKVFAWKVDGTEPPSLVATGYDSPEAPRSVSPDGAWLAVQRLNERTGADIWIVPMKGGAARLLAGTDFAEDHAAFSADGRWIAYTSNESGRDEVYVRPWPAADEKYAVSTEGGTGAVWARDGRRLFYAAGQRVVYVDVLADAGGARFRAGKPQPFIDGRVVFQRIGNYDLAPDAQRMVIVEGNSADMSRPRDLRVIFNWVEELKRKLRD